MPWNFNSDKYVDPIKGFLRLNKFLNPQWCWYLVPCILWAVIYDTNKIFHTEHDKLAVSGFDRSINELIYFEFDVVASNEFSDVQCLIESPHCNESILLLEAPQHNLTWVLRVSESIDSDWACLHFQAVEDVISAQCRQTQQLVLLDHESTRTTRNEV